VIFPPELDGRRTRLFPLAGAVCNHFSFFFAPFFGRIAYPPVGKEGLRDGVDQQIQDAVAGLSRRDGRSFELIVRRYQSMVFSLAYHFSHDRGLAEDMAQEVFLQLYRSAHTIKSAAHLEYWLRRVTVHRCIDYARRNHAPLTSLEDHAEPAAHSSESDPLLSGKLRQLVATLPARRRMVVLLRFQEELELHEIAEIMEMPINTVKSYLQRSLELLREKLARCLGDVTV
jgi:RNA polymerase sigma-70 factor (ECF subfamily)